MADGDGAQRLEVLDAADVRAVRGVARGEALGFADELVPDDVYRIEAAARPRALELRPRPGGGFHVESGASDGQPGRTVHLDSCLTLMAEGGATGEAIVLVEVEGGVAVAIYLLPLGRLAPGECYRLVGIDRHAGTERLAQQACTSFTRGTRIALADGTQVAVEKLRVGDRILTRDSGAQRLRWIGRVSVRATGRFAPVLIHAGVLNNARDLWLSPEHRIFVWQREDRIGAGRPELMVRVGHLVDGKGIERREGGFVEYFQLVFNDHQIIYAEGIAAESLLVGHRTRAALPTGLASHAPSRHAAYEVSEHLLTNPEAAALLRRASRP